MRPKKWGEFQHYQDGRNVKWIKNYLRLDMPGSDFRKLSWADQGRLQALWRLAARLNQDGMIPYDEGYLRAALGDKRFPFGSHLLPTWFHIGTQTELKRAANKEKRSRVSPQNSTLDVRTKKKRSTTRAVPVARTAEPQRRPSEQPELELTQIRALIDDSLRVVA